MGTSLKNNPDRQWSSELSGIKSAFEAAYGSAIEKDAVFLGVGIQTYEWKGERFHLMFKVIDDNGEAQFTSPQVNQEIQARIESIRLARQKKKDEEAAKARIYGAKNSNSL